MKPGNVWARQPFVGLALAAVIGIAVADKFPHPWVGLAVTLALLVAAWVKRSSLLIYCFAAASLFYLHGLRETDSPGIQLAKELGTDPKAIAVRGLVVTEPRISARGVASFHLRLQSIEREGQQHVADATILARWPGDARYGDTLQLFGVAQPVEGPRNPGEFDMRDYLARHDIRHALVVRYAENGKILGRGGGNPIMRAAHASRDWMQKALARGLEDSPDLHGLISGMVLGVRDDTPDEIEEQFQQTGTLHLFAVSGLNVAIVAQLLWIIATAVRIPRRWAVGLVILGVFFYAAVTGFNASSVRAALMAAVFLAGYFVDRKVDLGNTVGIAAFLVLGWDSNQLFSTGFQLSFAVVIMIVWLADPILRWLVRWSEPDPFLPRSLLNPLQRSWRRGWHGISRGLSVSLAAWIGSSPFILPYFYLVTPVSLLANLIVVPLAFFVLAVGLMSLVVMPVAPWVAIVFNNANWTLAAAILASVGLFSRAPAGHFYLERPHWPSGARAEITALDLGAGGAIHLRTRESDWLFDSGGARDFKRIVRGYLRSRGINHVDGLLLTHGDSGHIGAASAMLRPFRPAEIIDSAAPDRSTVHRELIAHLEEQHVPRRFTAAAEVLRLSKDVTLRVLFPPPGYRASNADDQAIVIQLSIANHWRVLLTSDSGEATERQLMASGEDLRSDIMIKGQHHSGRSGSAEFLDRVQPQLIVASCDFYPGKQRVDERWAADVATRGIKLFRQDQTGAVTIKFFRDRWEAKPYLMSETFRSMSR